MVLANPRKHSFSCSQTLTCHTSHICVPSTLSYTSVHTFSRNLIESLVPFCSLVIIVYLSYYLAI